MSQSTHPSAMPSATSRTFHVRWRLAAVVGLATLAGVGVASVPAFGTAPQMADPITIDHGCVVADGHAGPLTAHQLVCPPV